MSNIALNQSDQFCKEILPKVSRTFAINIAILKGNLHRAVCCGYLFCRIADTIEDSEVFSFDIQEKLLDHFKGMFENANYSSEAIAFLKEFFQEEATADQTLIQKSENVFNSFLGLEKQAQEIIAACVIEMTQGMKETLQRKQFDAGPIHTLKTMQDLDQYCYYVAGTVGKLLSRLFAFYSPSISTECLEQMQKLDVSFGLGLQVTNIIKDSYEDFFKRKWCYVPESLAAKNGILIKNLFDAGNHAKTIRVFQELIAKAQSHLDDAMNYTLLIPRRNIRIRLFCLWPLFFAVETLKVAKEKIHLFVTGEEPIKISRTQVKRIMLKTTLLVLSNALLKKQFN